MGHYGEVCQVKIPLKKFLLTALPPVDFTFMTYARQTSTGVVSRSTSSKMIY